MAELKIKKGVQLAYDVILRFKAHPDAEFRAVGEAMDVLPRERVLKLFMNARNYIEAHDG